jgi:hypothetical protein
MGRDLYYEIGLAASTMEFGDMQWRRVLIDHVAKHPASPVTAYYAEEWLKEEQGTEKP